MSTIEEEIKQKQFKNSFQKGAVNLIYTSGIVMAYQNQFFKQFGISTAQYNILRILRGQHPQPATISLLIDRMLDKTSNASRIVERLRKKELVSRIRRECDRRQVDVGITEAGLALLKVIDQEEPSLSIGFTSFSEAEMEQFNQLLDKLRLSFKNQLVEEK